MILFAAWLGCSGPATSTPGTNWGWFTVFPPTGETAVDTGTSQLEPLPAYQECGFASSRTVAVETTTGCYRGRAGGGQELFLGIRYAEPPVDELRWARPVPVAVAPFPEPEPDSGIDSDTGLPPVDPREPRDQFEIGLRCPQSLEGLASDEKKRIEATEGEDCLTLNLLRPVGTDVDEGLPTLVYLHDGGYVEGSGVEPELLGLTLTAPPRERPFPPEYLTLAREAILVTVNHRLGPLGFLAHPGIPGADGNQGGWDALEALKWVRTNIRLLGGHPDRIVLVGDGSGAELACALMASPQADGLFSATALLGGTCLDLAASPDGAQVTRLSEAVGCPDADAQCLRAVAPEDLLVALPARKHALDSGDRWGPVVGGELVPEPPAAALGSAARPPRRLLIGHNARDGSALAAAHPLADDEALRAALTVLAEGEGVPPTELIGRYPSGAFEGNPQAAWEAALTDLLVVCPLRATADLMSARGGAWAYRFLLPMPDEPGRGAVHGTHRRWLFGTGGLDKGDHPLSGDIQRGIASLGLGSPEIEPLGVWPSFGTSLQGGGTWLEIDRELLVTTGVRRSVCDWLEAAR